MLGEAIRSLPLRLSFTLLTIGSGHGDQALRDASLSPLTQRPPDARAQGARPQGDLAASRPLARAIADPRLPRRNRAGDESGRPAVPGIDVDLAGAGAAQARAA